MTPEQERQTIAVDTPVTKDEEDALAAHVITMLHPATSEQWGIFYNGQQITGYNGNETFYSEAAARRSFSMKIGSSCGIDQQLRRLRNLHNLNLYDLDRVHAQEINTRRRKQAWRIIDDHARTTSKKILKNILKSGALTFQRIR